MVGHASYLLLVVSVLMRSMRWLRILVIASAFTAIAYDTIWLKDPVGVFWKSLLVTINIIQIARLWLANRRARFSPEEERFRLARLAARSRAQARRVLNMELRVDGEAGVVLTREGEAVQNLAYLATGQVDIFLDDHNVGGCRPGNFVGEMSVLARKPASATAIVAAPSRYWLILWSQLRSLDLKEPQMAAALQMGIARDLCNRIISGNAASQSAG